MKNYRPSGNAPCATEGRSEEAPGSAFRGPPYAAGKHHQQARGGKFPRLERRVEICAALDQKLVPCLCLYVCARLFGHQQKSCRFD
jgi:hypothetical protein